MKNLYRPLLLVSLLSLAPIALIGCSGGSGGNSANQPSSTTRAVLTFTNVSSPASFKDINVKGALTPPVGQGADLTKDNGIYSYGSGTGTATISSNVVVSNKNGQSRSFEFQVRGLGVLDPTVNTTYNLATNEGFFSASRRSNGGVATVYLSNSGLITVTARSGSLVTLQLSNIFFKTADPADTDEFTVSGTLTYDLNNQRFINID